jgi:processive 1,2-diacylglycerol beta-glucosyltransferase
LSIVGTTNINIKFKKVLVLSASAGAGHVRAAQALERALIDLNAAEEVRHIDALDYTNKLFRNLYTKAYLDLVNTTPDLFGWLYDRLDKPWKSDRLLQAFDKLNTRPLVRLLREYRPEILICTHFLPSEIISLLKARERLAYRQAVVVTDFDAHAMWLCNHYEHYFVALDETRVYLTALGIPAEKVSVTGIPIDPVFAQSKDKRAMRNKHGLKQDRATILVSAGGSGVGPVDTLIRSLLQLRNKAQVIAICGRNQELKGRLNQIAARLAPDNPVALKVVGYTMEMDELMAASELVLGKPGGLTTSEALAKGLVFVIVNPIPGQEERNADHLLEAGAAIRCNNLPVLAYKIDMLLDDPARFSAMQANARRLARPRAAYEIVNKLLELPKNVTRNIF